MCDFGLVSTRIVTAGTPMYMAPELLLNKPFNKSVDVYAFGILLSEVYNNDNFNNLYYLYSFNNVSSNLCSAIIVCCDRYLVEKYHLMVILHMKLEIE